MFRNDLGDLALHLICDHCSVIIDTYPYKNPSSHERVNSRNKGRGGGRGRRMDFCNERCRIIFFRGRKYYQRKLRHMDDNDYGIE